MAEDFKIRYRIKIHAIILALWVILLMGVGPFINGQILYSQPSAQTQFDTANTYFEQGKYNRAIETYLAILDSSQAGSLYLNLGLSYVELDSLGKAKYYFLKAKEFPLVESRAEEALEYVNQRFSRQSAVLPPLPWEEYFGWLDDIIGYRDIIKIGFLILNLGVLFILLYWHWNRVAYRRWFRNISLIIVGVGILVLAQGAYLSYLGHRYHKAVMIQEQQAVYEQPNAEANVVSMSYEGYTFRVDFGKGSEANGWHYVRLSNGLYGWIPAEDILIL